MPQYRVRPGYRHGVGKKYGPGDMVTLTESEAAGFLDKLERVEEVSPVPTLSVVDEREEVASETSVMHFWQEDADKAILTIGTTGIDAPTSTPVLLPVPPIPAHYANFSDVVGIGATIQAALYEAGYLTWEDVLQAGVLTLRDTVPSISPSRARALFTRAQREAV